MLNQAGVSLLNQSVLLKGINDNKESLTELLRKLVRLKVKPYYLHQCDLVEGANHFRVPLQKALSLIKSLRGHISGLAQPTFVIDIPKGLGKVPLVHDFIVKEDDDFIYLSGFKDEIHSYPKI
jgi:lysine 2,3-aminomutase